MTMNPNDVPRDRLTPEDFQRFFARSTEQQERQAQAQRHASEWPFRVEQAVAALAGRAASHDERLSVIDARLTKLEAAMGISRD